MNSTADQINENLALVRERIERAAARVRRRPEEITIIAVSKTHSARKIEDLYAAGIRHFGENRVQEWEVKRPRVKHLRATWHMIGHLQKNKASRAALLFDSVDSVDSAALAERLDRERAELAGGNLGRGEKQAVPAGWHESALRNRLRVLIEVKLDPEPAKSGVSFDDAPRLVESLSRLSNLDLEGLMGISPYFDDPEEARPYFRRLRELRAELRAATRKEILPVLSMGMSHDFEVAIEEGATEVRIGTALFGEREAL